MAGVPASVGELGPGDSLGAGLAAMLSGADRYFALDVVRFANVERNLKIFDELVELFRRREPIPGAEEMPGVSPKLDSYEFPRPILTEDQLARALADDRVRAIRQALAGHEEPAGPIRITYAAPWYEAGVVQSGAADMVFSQATLQHVDDLELAYRSLSAWLRPGGYTTHQINLSCHYTAGEWNGHWAYSDLAWKILRGGRSYLINRQPHSVHVALLERHGFRILLDQKRTRESGIARQRLAPRFRGLSDEDLTTEGCFVIAVKRGA
jgi:hypothetical protein